MEDTDDIQVSVRNIVSFFDKLNKTAPVRRKSLGSPLKKKKSPAESKSSIEDVEIELNNISLDINSYEAYEKEVHQEFQSTLFNLLTKLVRFDDKRHALKKQELGGEIQKLFKTLNQRLPGKEAVRNKILARKAIFETKALDEPPAAFSKGPQNKIDDRLDKAEKDLSNYKAYEKEQHEKLQYVLVNLRLELLKFSNAKKEILDAKLQNLFKILKERLPNITKDNSSLEIHKTTGVKANVDTVEDDIKNVELELQKYSGYDKTRHEWYQTTLCDLITKLALYDDKKKAELSIRIKELFNILNERLPGQDVTSLLTNVKEEPSKTDIPLKSVSQLRNMFEGINTISEGNIFYSNSNLSNWRTKRNMTGGYMGPGGILHKANVRKSKSVSNLTENDEVD